MVSVPAWYLIVNGTLRYFSHCPSTAADRGVRLRRISLMRGGDKVCP